MGIDTVNLGRIDLNLLVHLDALLAERSVTREAARVGIGQSAMSHNLARGRGRCGAGWASSGKRRRRIRILAPPVRRGRRRAGRP